MYEKYNKRKGVVSENMKVPKTVVNFGEFVNFARRYFGRRFYKTFFRFESIKDVLVDALYQRRGKYAQPFVHTGMVGMMFGAVTLGPLILSSSVFSSDLSQGTLPSAVVLGVTDEDITGAVATLQSDEVKRYRGGEILEYEVAPGDTVGTIAEKFDISQDTILWANNMDEKDKIKPGQKIKVLPVTGILHSVKKGETIHSIAKKYGLEDEAAAQGIVNYPFNTFVDDENFTLAIGQSLVVPDGIMPEEAPIPVARPTYIAGQLTPDAGAVAGSGAFVWPASGRQTQAYRWYHRAVDIASKGGGAILAADSGRVVQAGWLDNSGYGVRIMIDHGNGFQTLYAHLSRVRVSVGQNVNRGDVIGDMGSTGRSTGTHLHFEIRRGGVLENPLNFLK